MVSGDLYHVSCKEYVVGQKLIAQETTPYYQKKISQETNWIDDILNDHKPKDAPQRNKTLFAFDFVGNCQAFFEKESCPSGTPKYYKVKMVNPIKSPMCLTDLIRILEKESPKVQEIAQEYWNPKQNWKYYEYLSAEMEIIEILATPSQETLNIGKANYLNDTTLRNRLFRQDEMKKKFESLKNDFNNF